MEFYNEMKNRIVFENASSLTGKVVVLLNYEKNNYFIFSLKPNFSSTFFVLFCFCF